MRGNRAVYFGWEAGQRKQGGESGRVLMTPYTWKEYIRVLTDRANAGEII
ncbi:MAG: hypothetical protein LUQ35_09700 [Methanoregula sp.]|nr:hypothetical protein [Methanoregula sp.]